MKKNTNEMFLSGNRFYMKCVLNLLHISYWEQFLALKFAALLWRDPRRFIKCVSWGSIFLMQIPTADGVGRYMIIVGKAISIAILYLLMCKISQSLLVGILH